eukprot:CAMPEP_0172527522 /NCGR_PEP_ID=MMETSP1067-20121228/2185_1 /TAXON_ID=265564 ORGANISM="Thalassiosira punctigera, Strain Tpunct2005C2" /NCGR_SAMPLE_ID=MMETSP1067 /ASSEMBLY_ACC=CAM_ASM_000444 /LENGTH=375 /DNA_ID=CAMNT_0013311271 /DNA_START=492 /DNA_END=1619 /DNA_ORIENTATION=+
MALFVSPSDLIVQHWSSPSQREAQFNYRNSHHKSSMKKHISMKETNVHARPMSKIKSPSNSYTQFYKEGVLVSIECTSPNSRRISGEIVIEGVPIDDIWNILADYDNLSTHVPNLVESKVINEGGGKIHGGRPRVYQRGAQRIFGFEFGADVTMDMTEYIHHVQHEDGLKMYSLDFECVDSQFFSEFDGSWVLEEFSNNKTMVRYIVDVRPKGPVPVAALEWRIKEDVPVNIVAVSKAARASGTERRQAKERIMAHGEEEQLSHANQLSLDRIPPPPRPQSNPLQQLTDRATQNIKLTAKSFLPAPVIASARQAIRAMNNSNLVPRARGARQKAVTLMSLDAIRRKKNGFMETERLNGEMDWYEDETMATYLKDL